MLKMEAKYSSEDSVDFQWNVRRYIAEDRTLHNLRCENLKSYFIILPIAVSEKRLLRRIFGLKRDGIIGLRTQDSEHSLFAKY
jgi:hypothetical protein